jgi:hypothetical protein
MSHIVLAGILAVGIFGCQSLLAYILARNGIDL